MIENTISIKTNNITMTKMTSTYECFLNLLSRDHLSAKLRIESGAHFPPSFLPRRRFDMIDPFGVTFSRNDWHAPLIFISMSPIND